MNPNENDTTSMESILHLYAFEDKINKGAQLLAAQGTQQIEMTLVEMLEVCESDPLADDNAPGIFLGAAALSYWRTTGNVEPVFYLYEKYYDVPARKKDPNSTLHISFQNVLIEMAKDVEGEERGEILGHGVRLITRKTPDVETRLFELLDLAQNLMIEGIGEGREIVQWIKFNAQEILERFPNLRSQFARVEAM